MPLKSDQSSSSLSKVLAATSKTSADTSSNTLMDTTTTNTTVDTSKVYKIVIAAGGSGGHLLPAQQLAEELLIQKNKVCFAAKGLQQNKNFQQKSFAFLEVSSGPLKKLHLLFKGFWQAWSFLRKYQPDLVVGFGSYHSFPVLLAAVVLRKKLIVFESNAVLGQVNRFFAKRAKIVALQFALQNQHQDKSKLKDKEKPQNKYKNIAFTPLLPWSKSFQLIDQKTAREKLGLDPEKPVLFIFGGSQGADFLNKLVCRLAFFWQKEKPFQIIHLTGYQKNTEKIDLTEKTNIQIKTKIKVQINLKMKIKKLLEELSIKAYVQEYSQDMGLLFSAANVVLSRSGAGTLSELIFTEKPALLVPFPFAKDNHQEINADFFEREICGGKKVRQNEIEVKALSEKLLFLLKQEKDFQKKLQGFKRKVQTQKRKSLAQMVQEALEN